MTAGTKLSVRKCMYVHVACVHVRMHAFKDQFASASRPHPTPIPNVPAVAAPPPPFPSPSAPPPAGRSVPLCPDQRLASQYQLAVVLTNQVMDDINAPEMTTQVVQGGGGDGLHTRTEQFPRGGGRGLCKRCNRGKGQRARRQQRSVFAAPGA